MKPFTLLLLGSVLLLTSCGDAQIRKIIFTSPDGIKRQFALDDGDGKITSGGEGKDTHRECQSLTFSVLESSYKVKVDDTVYYFPLDHMVEIPK